MARRLPYLTVGMLGAVLAGCLVVGAFAALVGGAASRVGSGPGGLAGLPQLALLAIAGPLGLASALTSRGRPGRAVLLLAGPLVVAFGYFFVAHAVDPCSAGVWDDTTTVGGAFACEYAGGYLGLSERLHLLEHAVVGLLLLASYAAALVRVDRRERQQGRRGQWASKQDGCPAGLA
jgi:hypothetical protein